jgi:23S rRNA pseudouridine955/2504/2580 synthase
MTDEGERRVRITEEGQFAHTIVTPLQHFTDYTLVQAELKTGRTHQIRVHLASVGFPILGDDKYGDFTLNKQLPKQGLKRMFLHAYQLNFTHPLTQAPLSVMAPLSSALQKFTDELNKKD